MMRILALFIVAVFLITTSCTQEYICQCVVKYEGRPPGLPDTAMHEFFIKDTKKKAAQKCEANSVTMEQDEIKMTEKCRLY